MILKTDLCIQYLGMDKEFWGLSQQAADFIFNDKFCISLYGEFERLLRQQNILGANIMCDELFRYLSIFALEYVPMAPAVYLGAYLPVALSELRELRIDEAVISDTLHDFERWATIYQEQFGRPGIGERPWVLYVFSGRVLQHGRLIYHQQPFPFPYYVFRHIEHDCIIILPAETIVSKDGVLTGFPIDTAKAAPTDNPQSWHINQLEILLAPGMPVLDIHIPKQGPLLPEGVDNSLTQAKNFYGSIGYPNNIAICESWLLDPALDIIAPNSNSRLFMQRFAKFPGHEPIPSIGKYIFGNGFTFDKLDSIYPKSSLQRSLKQYLCQGGQVSDTGGVLLL